MTELANAFVVLLLGLAATGLIWLPAALGAASLLIGLARRRAVWLVAGVALMATSAALYAAASVLLPGLMPRL